jgi:hypothetical protein
VHGAGVVIAPEGRGASYAMRTNAAAERMTCISHMAFRLTRGDSTTNEDPNYEVPIALKFVASSWIRAPAVPNVGGEWLPSSLPRLGHLLSIWRSKIESKW